MKYFCVILGQCDLCQNEKFRFRTTLKAKIPHKAQAEAFGILFATLRQVVFKKGNKAMFSKFLSDESGATAIEYALIAGFISIAIVPVIAILAGSLVGAYESVSAVL